MAALFDVPFAVSPAGARARLLNVSSPPRIFLFASGDNSLRGFSGRLPARVRGGGALRNRVFNPAWIGAVDLSNYFEAAGRDVSVVGGSFADGTPPVLRDALPYNDENRIARIRELLSGGGGVDAVSIQRVLRDIYSVTASRFVPLYLRLLDRKSVV